MFNHLWVIHHSSVLVERDSFKFKIIGDIQEYSQDFKNTNKLNDT